MTAAVALGLAMAKLTASPIGLVTVPVMAAEEASAVAGVVVLAKAVARFAEWLQIEAMLKVVG